MEEYQEEKKKRSKGFYIALGSAAAVAAAIPAIVVPVVLSQKGKDDNSVTVMKWDLTLNGKTTRYDHKQDALNALEAQIKDEYEYRNAIDGAFPAALAPGRHKFFSSQEASDDFKNVMMKKSLSKYPSSNNPSSLTADGGDESAFPRYASNEYWPLNGKVYKNVNEYDNAWFLTQTNKVKSQGVDTVTLSATVSSTGTTISKSIFNISRDSASPITSADFLNTLSVGAATTTGVEGVADTMGPVSATLPVGKEGDTVTVDGNTFTYHDERAAQDAVAHRAAGIYEQRTEYENWNDKTKTGTGAKIVYVPTSMTSTSDIPLSDGATVLKRNGTVYKYTKEIPTSQDQDIIVKESGWYEEGSKKVTADPSIQSRMSTKVFDKDNFEPTSSNWHQQGNGVIDNALTSGSLYYNSANDQYYIGLNDRYDYKYVGLTAANRLQLYPFINDENEKIEDISKRYHQYHLSFYPIKVANSILANGGNDQITETSLAEVGYANPSEGDKIFRFKTSFNSLKKYIKNVDGKDVIKMDMNDYEKYEFHKAAYVHKAHASLAEGFYENFPKTGHGTPDISPADIKAGDVISDGLKKYVKLDEVNSQPAISFRAKGWYDSANKLLDLSGKSLYKKNGATSTDFVTDATNAATEVKILGHVNSKVYKFPVMKVGVKIPVAFINVNSPEFGTKKPSTTPSTPTIAANLAATVIEKTPFVALKPTDAPHVTTIHALEDVVSGTAQTSITPVSNKHDVWKVDGSQITKRDGTHPATKVFKSKEDAIKYIMKFADVIKKATLDYYVDQGNGHDHLEVYDTKKEILEIIDMVDPTSKQHILGNKYIKEVDVKVDKTIAANEHYEIKESK